MIAWFWRAAWLLLPAAWLSHRFVHSETVTFFVSCAALIPLAKTMGDATEALAERMGHAAGSLLNATFGNAAELILAIAALRHGHVALVKGSITGSILGNLLLVAGAAIVTGGARFSRLRFNRLAATSSVSTLFLAVVAMVVPTLLASGANPRYRPELLSEEISAVLIVMYAFTLWFGVFAFTLLFVYLLDRRFRLLALEEQREEREVEAAIAERVAAARPEPVEVGVPR